MSGIVDQHGKPIERKAGPAPCPRCGEQRRVDASGFGPKKIALCGGCAYEFRGDE